jgi:hypothetical protein
MGKDLTKYFQDRVIKVDRGGPESSIGMLMDASEEYLCLLTEEDGIVYHNTKHIKNFTDNLKEQFKFDVDVPKDFEFKKAKNFKDLLKSLKYRWVNINRGGTESVEGVLCEVKNDLVCLVNNGEIVRIAMSHIKNVSYGVKIEKKAKSEKHESRQKSNDKSENNNNNTYCSPQVTSQKLRQESNDASENNNNNTYCSPQVTSQKLRQESNDENENNNNNTNNSPQGTSQILHQESIDASENNNTNINSIPQGTSQISRQESNDESENNNNNTNNSPQGTSQILRQESNDESEHNNNNTNNSPQGTWQKTSIENELDVSALLSSLFSLEKILRRLNF